MPRLTIETDSVAHAKFLSAFLKSVTMVKKVFIEPEISSTRDANLVCEPSEEYNWTNPSRPATDEEIDAMLDECEKSIGFTTEEVKNFVNKELRRWRKKRK